MQLLQVTNLCYLDSTLSVQTVHAGTIYNQCYINGFKKENILMFLNAFDDS